MTIAEKIKTPTKRNTCLERNLLRDYMFLIRQLQNGRYPEMAIDRNYFCGKPILIERAHREGVLRGFFDFRNDDCQNVRIESFTSAEVQLEFGGTIPISDICRIEEVWNQNTARLIKPCNESGSALGE